MEEEPQLKLDGDLVAMFGSPGWRKYLGDVEESMYLLVVGILDMDLGSPDAFLKFAELRVRFDQLRDMTYMYESGNGVDPEDTTGDEKIFNRFREAVKRFVRRYLANG